MLVVVTVEEAYRRLGIRAGANPKEVQLAYRKCVLQWHPDRAGSQEQAQYFMSKFLEVRDAYEYLRQRGFPVPDPEQVVQIPPESWNRWTAGRSFAPKNTTEDVPLSEKLGLKFNVSPESLVIWGILIPGGVFGLIYFLRFFMRNVSP